MNLRVEKRARISWGHSLGVLVLSCLAGFLAGGLLFLFKGVSPLLALQKIIMGSFGSLFGFRETVAKAIPLILTGAGLAVAFKGRVWNIGAEGQILAGAVGATGVALFAADRLPGFLVIPAMFLAGAAAGALWAFLPGILRARYAMNEAITTLMMNYIAAEVVQYLVYGPWKGKTQFGFPYSDDFPAIATLPALYGSRIHWPTLALGLAAAVILTALLQRSRFGFEVRVVGENPDAALYAGIDRERVLVGVMLLSGALAGMAGVGEVAGVHRHLAQPLSISSGYGFTAIITAYLARLNPAGVILSSLFFGGILVGGDVIQTSLGLPFSTVHVFNGTILFALLVGEFFHDHRVRFGPSSPAPTPTPPASPAGPPPPGTLDSGSEPSPTPSTPPPPEPGVPTAREGR